MIENLSPNLQSQVHQLQERWQRFAAHVKGRVEEVIAEANAGIDQLIAEHAFDHGPMGAAFSALQARFNGIDNRIDKGWEDCEAAFEAVRDLDDLPERDLMWLNRIWSEWSRQHRQLRHETDLHYQLLETRKNADWARRLRELAQREIEKGVSCTQCGGQVVPEVYWEASNVTCSHCQAVNSVKPGTAAALMYQGLGAHALSHEAALNEWVEEQNAKQRYDELRHPTAYDHWLWLQAAHAYYTRYYQTMHHIHPGTPETVEQGVTNKLKHYTAYDPPLEQQKRELMGRLLEAAYNKDEGTMRQLVQQLPHGVDLEECAWSLMEHGSPEGAEIMTNIRYDAEGETDPRRGWVQEQLRELEESIRTAG